MKSGHNTGVHPTSAAWCLSGAVTIHSDVVIAVSPYAAAAGDTSRYALFEIIQLMENLILNNPFVRQEEFMGSLYSNDLRVEDLHIKLTYSYCYQKDITGEIYGTPDKISQLERLMSIESLSLIDENNSISSNSVHLSQIIESFSFDKKRSHPHKIAEFFLFNLTHVDENRKDDTISRMTFILSGPSDMWHIFPLKYSREVVDNFGVERYEIGKFSDLKIYSFQNRFSDQSVHELHIEKKSHVLIVESESFKFSSIENFIDKCIKVIDDLLLIASFSIRTQIIWFCYYVEFGKYFQKTIISKSVVQTIPIKHHKLFLIWNVNLQEYFKTAYCNLFELRSKNIDLRLPILYFLSGIENLNPENNFIISFLALEKLLDLISNSNKTNKILSTNKFEKLRAELIPIINNHPEAKIIIEKLPELNRIPFRINLNSLLDFLQIDLSSLYPVGVEPTLINTRNKLIHSSDISDIDFIIDEQYRLEILIFWILLKLLGVKNIGKAVEPFLINQLSQKRA